MCHEYMYKLCEKRTEYNNYYNQVERINFLRTGKDLQFHQVQK